jgi:transposase
VRDELLRKWPPRGVSPQSLHAWLARYEAGGLEQLADGSHRPHSCLHQMPVVVEAAVLAARRTHPPWGPRRIAYEITKRTPGLAVSESAVYRCLRRAGLIEPTDVGGAASSGNGGSGACRRSGC